MIQVTIYCEQEFENVPTDNRKVSSPFITFVNTTKAMFLPVLELPLTTNLDRDHGPPLTFKHYPFCVLLRHSKMVKIWYSFTVSSYQRHMTDEHVSDNKKLVSIQYIHINGSFIKHLLTLNFHKTKCVWHIIDIFSSSEKPSDAFKCGV